MAIVLPMLLAGQVTVSVQLPPAGMIQKDQLWNLVLVNNRSSTVEAVITVNLQDAKTGQTILSAGSRSFTLGRGMKVIALADVQPIQYNFLATEFTSGFIPLGTYIACYRIIEFKGEGTAPIADECIRININPLSPPLLSMPADKSVLHAGYPQFSWIPPSPVEMFGNLNYEFVVAEVLPGQSPSEAVFNNVPAYANGNIRNPFQNYPSSFSSLQPGKVYAWQVTAKNGLNYSAQTEVWTFTLGSADSSPIIPVSAAYISLNGEGNGGVNFIGDKNLFISYYSFFKEHETTARILSPDGKTVQELKQKIRYGDNFLQFRLGRAVAENKVYTLEITDPRKVKRRIQFSVKK